MYLWLSDEVCNGKLLMFYKFVQSFRHDYTEKLNYQEMEVNSVLDHEPMLSISKQIQYTFKNLNKSIGPPNRLFSIAAKRWH